MAYKYDASVIQAINKMPRVNPKIEKMIKDLLDVEKKTFDYKEGLFTGLIFFLDTCKRNGDELTPETKLIITAALQELAPYLIG